MQDPEISIIMPVFNGSAFLNDSIGSILNQSFTDFELIIVNDGSTDNSASIISGFQKDDPRIIFINRPDNKKLPYTLNEALSIAKGKYIAIMDCDDISYPNRLEIQYRFLEENKDISIIGCGYQVFNEQGAFLTVYNPSGCINLAYKFLSNSYFCHPTVMFRRNVIEKSGLYEDHEAEDFCFFSKILRNYKGTNLQVVLLKYRENPANRSISSHDPIEKSAEQIYSDNYFYYTGFRFFADRFYAFHKYNRANVFLLPLLLFLSFLILNRIRKNYNYPFFSKEFLSNAHKPFSVFIKGKSRSMVRKLKEIYFHGF